MHRGTDKQTTDTQTAATNIHFALATSHVKCNQAWHIYWINSKQQILTSYSSSASRCDCKTGNVFNNCNQTVSCNIMIYLQEINSNKELF